MVADVLVELTNKAVDQTFTYKIPSNFINEIKVGIRVLVPFGNRSLEGFVLKVREDYSNDYELKEITSLVDTEPVLNMELLSLGEYMSKKTLATLSSCYQTMLPKALKAKNNYKMNEKYIKYIRLINKDYTGKNDNQNKIISLLKLGDIEKKEIVSSSLNTLIKNNVVEEYTKEVYRLNKDIKKEKCNITLTEKQQDVVNEVVSNLDSFKPYLLHGVTGSGKTEVYMHIIKEVLKEDKEVIVLVPEISLTPQLIEIFKKRFGNEVAILHSKLSDGERYDEYRKIKRGEVKIVIGARSAIFAPFTNLGLIIVDEEHTHTYKQENNPRYNALDIAHFRSKYHNAKLILGSATPSIESYTKAKIGVYELMEMKNRVNNNLPKVSLVDMRCEYKKGNRIISEELKDKMIKAINNDEQVMLLLNRRGYSTTTTCKKCGFTLKCPNCDIPLIYHKSSNHSRCHYCGYAIKKIDKCLECGGLDINDYGMGTEKLEQYITDNIENAKVIRMDVDTTSTKGAHAKIIKQFENKEFNVLIGTQMIAKGLDFKDVSVVGVINADQTLNIPDFRSSERTFQLLNQVAGRAGRSKIKGEVVIQGFNIDHYSIVCASNHNYDLFYKLELDIRKKLGYSPYYNLCLIKLSGKNLNDIFKEGEKIVSYLKSKNLGDTKVLGPSTSNIPKINNIYNAQIVIKYKNTDILKKELLYVNDLYKNNKIKVECDLNPIRM